MNDINDHKDGKRLADIERRLDQLQADREQKDRPSQSALPEGMAAIMGRVATELAAGYFDEHKGASDSKRKGDDRT